MESAYYQTLKLKVVADSILMKVPKVESLAIQEMRKEINKMLNTK